MNSGSLELTFSTGYCKTRWGKDTFFFPFINFSSKYRDEIWGNLARHKILSTPGQAGVSQSSFQHPTHCLLTRHVRPHRAWTTAPWPSTHLNPHHLPQLLSSIQEASQDYSFGLGNGMLRTLSPLPHREYSAVLEHQGPATQPGCSPHRPVSLTGKREHTSLIL